MRPSALAACAALTLAPASALAQACCGAALGSAGLRLRDYDRAAVQLDLGGDRELGLWDTEGRFHPDRDSLSVDLRQTLQGAMRLSSRLELSGSLPLQLGYRSAGPLSEWGGGLGDVATSARYALFRIGEHSGWPGISAALGALIPTGRSAEASKTLLAADVTGGGSFRWGGEISLDFARSDAFLSLSTGLGARPRENGLELELQGRATAGWTVGEGLILGGNVQLSGSPGRAGPDVMPPRLRPTAGLFASLSLGGSWYLVGSATADLPLSGLGRNEPSLLRALVGIRRAFLMD